MDKAKIKMFIQLFSLVGDAAGAGIKFYITKENILFQYQYHRKVPMRYFLQSTKVFFTLCQKKCHSDNDKQKTY